MRCTSARSRSPRARRRASRTATSISGSARPASRATSFRRFRARAAVRPARGRNTAARSTREGPRTALAAAHALLQQPRVPGHRVPRADGPGLPLRDPDRAAAHRGEPDAAPDHVLPDRDRGRRDGVAAALGLLVARTALTPVRRLTETTERSPRRATSRSGSSRPRPDTTSSAGSPRASTRCSRRSRTRSRAQRQLVADASHELRTPLTSLKTNIEVLARGHELSPETREQLLHDLVEQIDEMTALIGELIELAREARPDAVAEPARTCASTWSPRTRSSARGATGRAIEFETDFDESLVSRRPVDDRAGGRQPARQRGQVEPARRPGRGRGPAGRGLGARPRPGDLRRGPAATSSTASTARARRAGCPARASGSRSSSSRRGARRLGRRRAAGGRRDADAPAAERSQDRS